MKPIYKFTLDEETGKINVQELTGCTEGKWSNKERYWRYRGPGCWMYIYESKLDKYLSGHVYSFNPDIEHAKEIIVESIGQRLAKAQADVTRWAKVFMMIHTEIK